MNKKLQFLAILFGMFLVFSSCSKDKMLEKRLHKKEGEWNIEKVDYTIVYQTSSGQQVESGIEYDAGTFTFDKETGSFSYKVAGFQRTGSFKWSVDDEKITIVSASQSFSFTNPSLSQKAISYAGREPAKNSIILEGTETEQSFSNDISQFVLTGTFDLSKK